MVQMVKVGAGAEAPTTQVNVHVVSAVATDFGQTDFGQNLCFGVWAEKNNKTNDKQNKKGNKTPFFLVKTSPAGRRRFHKNTAYACLGFWCLGFRFLGFRFLGFKLHLKVC